MSSGQESNWKNKCPNCGTTLFGTMVSKCYKYGAAVAIANETEAHNLAARAAELQRALWWAGILHPWVRRSFLQHKAYIEESSGFLTGAEGLARFARLPSLRKATARCSRCRKRISAYKLSFNPMDMPGCSRCEECGGVFCRQCESKIEIEGWNAALSSCPNCKKPLRRFLWREG